MQAATRPCHAHSHSNGNAPTPCDSQNRKSKGKQVIERVEDKQQTKEPVHIVQARYAVRV